MSLHYTSKVHYSIYITFFFDFTGFIADKFGGFKVLLFVALLMVGTCHTALLWVPQVRGGASLNTVEVFCGSEETNVHINYMVPVEDCSANERIAGRLTDCIAECPQTYSHSGQPPGSPEVAFCSMSLHSGRNTCLSFNSNSSTYMLVMPPKNGSVSVNEDLRHISFSSKSQINSTFNSCKNLHENNCTLVCVPSSSLDQLWVSKCGDRTVTFWLYLIIRILAAIFMSSCFILLDSITLCTIEGHNTDYGKQRLWPVLATAIFPPVTGFLVDYFSPSEGKYSVI